MAETMAFRTELKQLLLLITHSLYSNKEIFLRELISNACDAINKVRFDSLSHKDLLEGDRDWKIRIRADREAGTLTVSDNGIGMDRDSVIENLGTIAKSGTRAFLEALRQQEQKKGAAPDLIGQFGVGFYSAFMVASHVTVTSRMAGVQEAVRWESDGQGEFTVEPVQRERRGTDVTLLLKPEAREFLDPYRLREVIRKFSDFIEHPVILVTQKENDGEKTLEEEVVNSRKAIWLRSKSEVTQEEYTEFFKQITHGYQPPLEVIHYAAEGSHEFKALLFLPAEKPFEMQLGDYKWGPRLYIQRVLIMDHCEALLPPWLRFVQGVVDSSDLPLNISREMLQESPLLGQIRSSVTRSVLKALEGMKESEYEKYVGLFKELGSVLKECPARDPMNADKVADLLLFESLNTPAGEYIDLAKYLANMPVSQAEVYYLTGESREQLAGSPYVEEARSRGYDVLLLTDPVDEYLMMGLREYKGKKLRAVDTAAPAEDVSSEEKEKFAGVIERLKPLLPEVANIRLTARLKDSPCCLVSEGVSANFERLMARWGREAPPARRILELNPKSPAVQGLLTLPEGRLELHARVLYDLALIGEGSHVKDPAALSRRVTQLLANDRPGGVSRTPSGG
jgi:molecular chaperone HtpG